MKDDAMTIDVRSAEGRTTQLSDSSKSNVRHFLESLLLNCPSASRFDWIIKSQFKLQADEKPWVMSHESLSSFLLWSPDNSKWWSMELN